jgi:hypothetical protein
MSKATRIAARAMARARRTQPQVFELDDAVAFVVVVVGCDVVVLGRVLVVVVAGTVVVVTGTVVVVAGAVVVVAGEVVVVVGAAVVVEVGWAAALVPRRPKLSGTAAKATRRAARRRALGGMRGSQP